MTKNLDSEGLKSIAENYDLFYIDLWGVMHNGIELHESAIYTLKKLLKMNPDLDLTLKYFKPGIEILFPSRDVIETTNFVVDRDAARLFYEVNLYYAAFGQEFNRGTAEIARLMQSR